MQHSALATLVNVCLEGCWERIQPLQACSTENPKLKLRVWTVDISEREVLVREPMQIQADTSET